MDQDIEELVDSQLRLFHALRIEINEGIRSLIWLKTRARTRENVQRADESAFQGPSSSAPKGDARAMGRRDSSREDSGTGALSGPGPAQEAGMLIKLQGG